MKSQEIELGGSYGIKVVVKDSSKELLKLTQMNVKNALKAMADATDQRAKMLAPMLSGELRTSSTVSQDDNGYTAIVRFGNGIEYAAYQERGMRYDGTHIVRNYTTAGTGPQYLHNAGESVKKEGIKNYL